MPWGWCTRELDGLDTLYLRHILYLKRVVTREGNYLLKTTEVLKISVMRNSSLNQVFSNTVFGINKGLGKT